MIAKYLPLLLSALLTLAVPAKTPALARSNETKPTPAPARTASPDAYDGLPLGFEQNVGQADARVRFLAHAGGYTLLLSDREAVFSDLTMRFDQASSVRMEEPLPGVTNYLIGNDPAKWRTGLATYAKVRYEGVAPGVDLVFYGTQARPEYDFVVAPGADPRAIEISFEGASGMRVDADGDLVMRTAGGKARQPRPAIYQETASGRRTVSGGYAVEGARVRFNLGAYDARLPLVIDPVLSYASYIGGNDDDRLQSAAVDASGNLYVAGFTNSSNFPTQGALQANQSGQDAFLAKVNSSGTALLFSTYVGGGNTDNFNDVAVDGGHIYAAGSSSSNDLPTVNGYDENPNGLDAILMVFNLSGTAVTYGTFIGGGNNDIGDAVAVDIHGNAYLAGETLDSSGIFNLNFPTKSPSALPPFQDNYGGGRSDAFVCKFDPDQSGNSSLTYSTLLGGSAGEGVLAIAVDEFERAYVCGYTESTNFDRLNAIQNTYGGGTEDGFITKFNADGTTVFYSTFYGGSAIDEALGIALDESTGTPRPVVVGFSTSPNLQTQFATQPAKNGPQDCFALELNDAGSAFVYATYFGGPGNDSAQAVTVDADGNAFFTGFSNNAYPLVNPIPVNGTVATTGVTMTKLSSSGSVLLSTCVSTGNGNGIGLDPVGNVYVAGTTSSTSFPTTAGAFQTTFHGAPNDGFVLKLDLVDDDTIGVFKPGTRQFQLRNSNQSGSADLTATFGVSGDKPIVGDWDGNGTTTIGSYTPSTGTFSLRNSNSTGSANVTFTFGAPNEVPVAGDWNGDGVDTIGLYIPSTRTFQLRNQNAGGGADLQFVFGPTNAQPVAGDWNGDGVDTVGTFSRLSTLPFVTTMVFSLRNSNSAGSADLTVSFGVVGDLPVTGNWDGQ